MNYSGIFRAMCNPGTFKILVVYRNLAQPEPWNSGPEAYSDPCHHLRWSVLRKPLKVKIIFETSAFQFIYLMIS